MGTTRVPNFDGRLVRQARQAKGWSQGRLAVALDMAMATIVSWERGRATPEPATFVQIARVLGVQPADLLTAPPDQWSLVDLRVVNGLTQREVAAQVDLHPDRLSRIENAYERLTESIETGLAETYGVDRAAIEACWERTRAALLDT